MCGYIGPEKEYQDLIESFEKVIWRYPDGIQQASRHFAEELKSKGSKDDGHAKLIICDPKVTIIIDTKGNCIELDDEVIAFGPGGLYA